jgi:hypothetical protein
MYGLGCDGASSTMNNPESTHAIPKFIGEVPVSARSDGQSDAKYSDSAGGFPLIAEKRFTEVSAPPAVSGYAPHAESESREVAEARIGATVFSGAVLPVLLWVSGSLGLFGASVFAVFSAIGAFRLLLADPGARTAGFVCIQMTVTGVAVMLHYGVIAGAVSGFFLLPASLLALATLFGRWAEARSSAGSESYPVESAVCERPNLHVVRQPTQSH